MDVLAPGSLMTALDSFFDSYYRLRPVNATFTGVHDHDHRLPDWSPEGLAAARDEMMALRATLGAPSTDSAVLRDGGSRDRALAAAFLDIQLAEDASVQFSRGNPSLAAGEAIFGLVSLMTRPFAAIGQRADAAIARLAAVPAFLTGATRSITEGVPPEWRARTLRECDGADRLLDDGVSRWIAIESIDDGRAQRLEAAARSARQAFDDFRRWLMREAAPAGPDRYACGPVDTADQPGQPAGHLVVGNKPFAGRSELPAGLRSAAWCWPPRSPSSSLCSTSPSTSW